MKNKFFALITPLIFALSCSSPQRNLSSKDQLTFLDPFHPKSREITYGTKTFDDQLDHIYRDGWGREVIFRGWNISGHAKDTTRDNLNFTTLENANILLKDHRAKIGSNITRWIVNWQGIEKKYGVYDKEHLKKQVDQIKIAIKNGMYVFLDFHQDIFTKYIKDNAGFDGNGAPKWVIDGMNLKHRDAGCWIVKVGKLKKKCTAWSMSYFLNKGVVEANDKFWANHTLKLKEVKVPIWDAFLDMLEATMSYLEENLTEEEFSYIIGLDPINEPAPGKLKVKDATRFINDRLYNLYEKVRLRMDRAGWKNKLLMAEPLVFWNVSLKLGGAVDLLVKPLGFGHLENPPGKGWVWNAHFYDEKREAITLKKKVKNGAYLANLDSFREVSRLYKWPTLVSEFGVWPMERKEVTDLTKRLKAMYQALDFGRPESIILRKGIGKKNRLFADTFGNKIRSRYVGLYSTTLSSTQWDWNATRGDLKKALKPKDPNTPEGFLGPSLIALNKGGSPQQYFENSHKAFERGYVRRVAGNLLNSYYNDNVHSEVDGAPLQWVSLRPDPDGEEYFYDKKFFWMIWRPSQMQAASEIFIPRHFDLKNTVIVTHDSIKFLNDIPDFPNSSSPKIFKRDDIEYEGQTKGKKVYLFNSISSPYKNFHQFALIVDLGKNHNWDIVKLKALQGKLRERLRQKKNSLFLRGKILVEKSKTFNVKDL